MLWFHPLVWLAGARLRSEAEHSADDRVLTGGTGASSYAQQLLDIARRLKQHPPHAAVAMTRRPRALESRIAAILDSSRARTSAGTRARLTVMVTGACLLLFLAACQSARIYKVAQVQTPPKVVSKVEPNYTDDARTAKIERPVVLSLIVDTQCRAQKIRVTKSLDKGMDQEAIAAIEKWAFCTGHKRRQTSASGGDHSSQLPPSLGGVASVIRSSARYCFLAGAAAGGAVGLGAAVAGAGRAAGGAAGRAAPGAADVGVAVKTVLSYRSITSLVISTVFDA